MAVNVKKFAASQQLTASNAIYYTATNVKAIVDKCTVCNTTVGAVTLTIDIVDSGDTAGVTERVISARSIAAGETYNCPEMVGQILESGDTIEGLASAATSLTIRISGREIT
jgi:hypothetical protein